ncbi:MAG: pyridoxal-phosphate dependent enzyme [Thermomicrobiales bacterium]|nr:pyridoxal-phosphate dependent enzyme [Thermomicrobiales bacterium]
MSERQQVNDSTTTTDPLASAPALSDIYAAKIRIAPYLWRTPIFESSALSSLTGTNLRMKAENLQRTGAFKARGAINAVLQLSEEARARGVVTFSAGNHGQALAYAARLAGVRCTVFMAENAVPTKVEAIRGYGAETRFGPSIREAFGAMEQFAEATGAHFVSPFSGPHVIAGQGTIGLEILEDFPEVEQIVVGCGGGGLLSGVALAVKAIRPDVRIVGVEPEGASTMWQALRAGKPVQLDKIETIADGLAAPFTTELPLAIVQRYVDDVVLVSDDEILNALRLILARTKLLVEPAGAASTAALLTNKAAVPHGANTVTVLSGGNIDLARLKSVL